MTQIKLTLAVTAIFMLIPLVSHAKEAQSSFQVGASVVYKHDSHYQGNTVNYTGNDYYPPKISVSEDTITFTY